jgi:hypothetical protein
MMEVTSDCVVYSPSYAKVSDLIGYCLDYQKCLDGNYSCQVLNHTISNLLKDSILYGSERKMKGYELSITYSSNITSPKNIFNSSKGICNSTYIGAPYPLPHYPGVIDTKIKVCY